MAKQNKKTKKPIPIRTDLFRFVTIRTPQLISQDKREWGYIYHPDKPKGHFLENVDYSNLDSARAHIQHAANNFNKILSIYDIRKTYPDMYNFSSWLFKNRNLLNEDEVASKITGVTSLTAMELSVIWDNLFYEIVKRENHVNRQAFIQIIIANNFIESVNTPEIKAIAKAFVLTPKDPSPPDTSKRYSLFLRRLANAVIVVPKAFSIKKIEPSSNNFGLTKNDDNTKNKLPTTRDL